MSVKSMDRLSQLLKDSQATRAERATMLAAFRRDQEMRDITVHQKKTLLLLKRRAKLPPNVTSSR